MVNTCREIDLCRAHHPLGQYPLQWCVGGGGGAGGGGPWSIKSAPSAIPFDTPVTGMSPPAPAHYLELSCPLQLDIDVQAL